MPKVASMSSVGRVISREIAHPVLRRPVHISVPLLRATASVRLNDDGIAGVASVSAWNNHSSLSSAFDLDVNVGTLANRKPHPSDSVLLYGANGDRPSSPDSVAASITSDISLFIDLIMDDWAPPSIEFLFGKSTSSGNQRAYEFSIDTSGRPGLLISSDGTGAATAQTVADTSPGFTNGERGKLLIVWNNSANTLNVYKASVGTIPTDIIWAQVGTADRTLSISGIFDSTSAMSVGANAIGQSSLAGAIFKAEIYSGGSVTAGVFSGGTLAVSMDAKDYRNKTTDTTFTSGATGEEWTLVANSFIQNTGHKVVHSIGSNGIETTLGQTILSPGTVLTLAQFTSGTGTPQRLFDERTSLGRWMIFANATTNDFSIFQNDPVLSISGSFDTNPHLFTGQFNGDSTTKLTVSDVGNVVGTSGSENWDFGMLFAASNGGTSMAGFIASMDVFPYALNKPEILAMQDDISFSYNI